MSHELLPHEQDANIKTRILHDAELLNDGADVIGGVVRPTGEQIEGFVRDHEGDATVGRLALYNSLEEKSSVPVEKIVKGEENRTKLMDAIATVIEPYDGIFTGQIPSRTKNDKTWRGQLKDSIKLQPWQETRPYDHVEPTYNFSGTYKPGETVNLPQRIAMVVSDIGEISLIRSQPAKGVTEVLEYQDGKLHSIDWSIGARNEQVMSIDQMSGSTTGALEKIVKASGGGSAFMGGQVKLVFGRDQILSLIHI